MVLSTTPKITETPINGVFSGEFARQLERELRGQISKEKVEANLRQIQLANVMRQAGPAQIEGLGQLKASIDPRIFFRWQREYPGCWNDPGFVKKMLKDNPEMCAPGYRP